MTSATEQTETAPATAEPKPTPKARAGQPRANVAPTKPKSGKKAPKGAKAKKTSPAKKATGARDGSKTARVLELLKRPRGATAKELMKATGWQPHSVRGFLSGIIGKKMGLTVTSLKSDSGERSYSVKA